MSRVAINTGSVANDGTGDNLRIAGGKINSNFSELYTFLGDGTDLTPVWSKTSAGINTISNVGVGTTNPRFSLEVGSVGSSGTSLYVNGNARVTGILTVGSSSIILDGYSNKITIGSGVTIDGNSGIVSASAFYAGGSIIGGGGGSGLNYWLKGATGITTTSNVGVATDSAPSALTVGGNSLFSGIATFRNNVTLSNLTSSSNTLRFGSNSYIDQSNSDAITFQINSGTDTSSSDSSFVFRTTKPGISPNPDQAYDALRVYSGGNHWDRLVRVYTNFHADNDAFVAGDLQVGAASTLIGLGNTLGTFKVGAGGTVITTTSSGFVGIGSGQAQRDYITSHAQTADISAVNSKFSTPVGNFVTDINTKPYVQAREVKVLVTGLRPNTRHYFYFQQAAVDTHVYPGTINSTTEYNVSAVQISGTKGGAVRTDSEGTLSAVFKIPADTFFVGENVLEMVDVNVYANIESTKTSYSKATYRAFNFDIGKSELNYTTRTGDIDVSDTVVQRQFTRAAPTDPIAQTFKIRTAQAAGASTVMLSEIEVYFKTKSIATGVTIELREVVNGYPAKSILPFARKHLRSSQVNVSTTAAIATTFEFKNPVKLNVEKEYCFVVIPDANSPDYLIWTSKVGGTDVATGVSITNDWGDGILFTSTNDSAWKSYQDEDIKFSVKRYDFQTTGGYINLVPNDVEFLTVRGTTNNFVNDELAFIKKSTSYTAAITGDTLQTITIAGTTLFAQNDYVYIESGANTFLSKISVVTTTVVSEVTTTTLTIETPYNSTTTSSATAYICVAGRVSHFDNKKPDRLFLKASSATATNFVDDNASTTMGSLIIGDTYTITNLGEVTTIANWNDAGATGTPYVGQQFVAISVGVASDGTARDNSQVITGYDSGASATITTVDNEPLSYFQPQILANNSIRTSTDLTLYNGEDVDKTIPANGNVYMLNSNRIMNSKSRIVNTGDASSEDFIIRVTMSNGGYKTASPILDADLSILNVYQYQITSSVDTSSSWISKEIVLQEQLDANGLKVFMSAYRPAGTIVDAYVRFTYPTNVEVQSDWILIDNQNPDLYSNTANTKDYRQFEYILDEATYTYAYSSFQMKFVLRHATDVELYANDLTITPSVNLFPHIYDYRAIALT